MTYHVLTAYLDELETALELRDTPESVVSDVLRQVESHVHDSGQNPYEAFGEPGDYAQNFAPRARTTRFWTLVIASVILTVGGGWLLLQGVLRLDEAGGILWGVDPWYGIGIGGLAITAWIVLILSAGRVTAASHLSRDRKTSD